MLLDLQITLRVRDRGQCNW